MSGKSDLEDLLVDEQELNEKLLAETVGDYVQIGKESGDLVPNERYRELSSKEKIIVTLLAQKARHELDLDDQESLGPTAISSLSGVKKNTVYPAVRDLDDEGLIRGEDGEYRLPTMNVEKTKEYLSTEE
jgi:hypothetical protein